MPVDDTLELAPGGSLRGTITIPGDKSISHRAVMFGALADGTSQVDGCLMGEDVLSTIAAMRAMGVSIEQFASNRLTITGAGVDGLRAPLKPLDVGNSGTSMRLLCGILAGAQLPATLTGDPSLSQRPMRRVSMPLTEMGAYITTAPTGTPPLTLTPGTRLHGIDYLLPMASAQVKSAVLLAGLFAEGETTVREPGPTRDHTERMLGSFGVALAQGDSVVSLRGGQRLSATDITVPADISSAAFFLVGASIAPASELLLPAVGVNPTRTGIIDILRLMGADISLANQTQCGAEPVADLRICHSNLTGCDIPTSLVPLAIDEFPAVFVAAACAAGTTTVRGAAELRHKESDRIAVMAEGLVALGVEVETFDDGIAIHGGRLTGGRVDARGDHRIAMAFAMAALRASGPIIIDNAAAVATSFPEFVGCASDAGLRFAR